MAYGVNILELNTTENTWLPPELPEEEMAYSVREDVNALPCTDYLYIFQTEPYIDSIFIEYNEDRDPIMIKRFAIHEGYTWDFESEQFFHKHICMTCQYFEECSDDMG